MTIIVEDGSGVAGANSYVSVADFAEWLDVMGYDVLPDDKQEPYLLRAAQAMEVMHWIGKRASDTQALAWPRTDVVMRSGEILPSDQVPAHIVTGQQQLAREMYAQDTAPVLEAGANGPIISKTERIEGAITVTTAYANDGNLMYPRASDGSRTQFADYLERRGLFAVRA